MKIHFQHKWYLALIIMLLIPTGGASSMEKVSYGGWAECLKLTNGKVELIITSQVGPRVIRAGFVGEQNLMKEYQEFMGLTGGDEWRIYGGHRFWHAPEAIPRTYYPDNQPVEHHWDGTTLVVTQPIETTTKLQKQIEFTLAPDSNHVCVVHRLINHGMWPVELAPWCLTVMAEQGRVIIPQEDYRPHPEYLLPARPMVLWHYTDLSDPRWTLSTRYTQLRQDPNADTKQKIGLLNKQGWAAYELNGDIFMKLLPYDSTATYPDYGCNLETYTDPDMIEFETVGPLTVLEPQGGQIEHVEEWFFFKGNPGQDDDSLDQVLLPLLQQAKDMVP